MSRLVRKAGGGRALDSDAGILPLINVVFLLLIFFMIAGQLAEQAPFEVEPPASDAEAQVSREELLVLLAADGRAAVAGQTVTMEAVVEHVLAALAKARQAATTGGGPSLGQAQPQDGAPGAGPAPGGFPEAVRLRADAGVEAARIVGLIEELRAAGVEKITLMTAGRS
ncbi:ExbD/TolR family protein [Marinibaculum pumilum]|uniref:ExbD/TolR family protein n=1 Tax=Marinibaculum pumilum TaxID=1766165 RepID=A0ABV7L8Q2_9PROT